MKITNNYNLPEAIYKLCSKVYRPEEGVFSVTDLVGPPMIRYLKMKHWDELVDDASNRLWQVLGQAIHSALQKIDIEDGLVEEKISINIDGVKIVGRPDLWQEEVITDWKCTSVYSFIFGAKKEWEAQLNCYAFLYRSMGFETKKLRIYAILRDWMQSRATERDYPSIPFLQAEIPLWDVSEQEDYIRRRIAAHYALTPCTDEEMWVRPSTFAVMKEGSSKAMRVFDTSEEAQKFQRDFALQYPKIKTQIEERKGRNVRCESYCIVRDFCENRPR
ncbi:MAG: hypothetical protein QW561_03080 [Candidatus Aenigmatarchaeota archaeon]